MHASLYKIKVKKGDMLKRGDVLAVLEAMKMESSVFVSTAQEGLIVQSVVAAPGDIVRPGDTMMVLSSPLASKV